jgi:2-C-methyl-D-erythritol 4-phosphate cytidylyltransferase / 2-C-methyl-D-erythritol 2,4-cyclodiphosphate synthase
VSAAVPVPVAAIVVAAGASRRMGGTDKLLAPIGGRPLLAWTVEALVRAVPLERLVVVAAAGAVGTLREAASLPDDAVLVEGAERRQDSVAAGVAALVAAGLDDAAIVLVHDGARPALTGGLVRAVAAATAEHGAAIPVLPVAETLKRVEDGRIAGTVDRSGLAAAQTPQGVRLGLLRAAYARFPPGGPEIWTDEASLLEACSIPVHAIQGHADNLKVTMPADLERASALLAGSSSRVGVGDDAHPFGPGRPLALGGIEVDGAPRLHGHSEGDVALHAVADALLGAAGLGDLGRLFPADHRTPRGIASRELVAEVVRRLDGIGLVPAGVDVVIVGARPRLGGRLDAMREAIAGLLGVPADRVNVKASTGNLDGMEGGGRGISARAVAVVERRR